MKEPCTQHAVTACWEPENCKSMVKMNECCTQHAVTACWELKNDANMIRNERTLHTVRGYRVLGAQKRFKYGKN